LIHTSDVAKERVSPPTYSFISFTDGSFMNIIHEHRYHRNIFFCQFRITAMVDNPVLDANTIDFYGTTTLRCLCLNPELGRYGTLS